jgi:hypothetical protein
LSKLRTFSKRLEIRFDAPELSSDGGILVLSKLDKRLCLTERMASCLRDPRKGTFEHSLWKMCAQRVYGICLGWEDCNDFDTLKDDTLYEVALGEKAASQPTLSRFENSVGYKDLYKLSIELVRVFIDAHKANPPSQIVVDMDATEDPAHGQQEFEFYHGYYGAHCFLPLLVFCSADDGDEELVGAILRPGNIHAGRCSASILRRLAGMLKEAFPSTRILFRGDAGFALPEMYECAEELGISYLISLPRNPRLQEVAEPLMTQARAQRDQTGCGTRVFGETLYAAQTWSRERRVLIKAEVMEKGDNPRFVVTNLSDDPEELYAIYCKRGDCENRIKELKLDLASGRTSCHRFRANCFRLILHALAFVLLTALRKMLASTGMARATMGQIRLKILKVAAMLQTSTRRILVRLPRDHPHRRILTELLA